LVNGANYGVINSYTFENVQENGTISVVFVDEVGIDENISVKINVYPNPTNSQLIIGNGKWKTENEEYRIYSAIGQLLGQGKLQGETTIVNVTSLANGIYYLQIGNKTVKFVKE